MSSIHPPRRILVLNANPKPASLSQALAERYAEAASTAGHAVQLVHLHALRFEPDLRGGYANPQVLEPDLQQLQRQILEAEHLVLAYPVWWGSVPALFKGLLDRLLLPGFAFRYDGSQSLPEQLLKGRSARLLVCMDTPAWYFRWFQGAPAHRMMKNAVLGFCGIAPIRISSFAPVIKSTPEQRAQWLEQAADLGRQGR
ncbi:NADPH:quinone reductase [Paucibacter aquatile]|uniref:NADPH:quinone reductase n=1 Tax=Kinneretia aquatilis TaxID=2070761 RepID=A0A2N8L079_9BURK|nr:NAD(P)H-dependent oxidoreductase [Paucibacter aquatile]PND39106.1 NADPH:quinone reductase [Paucibacter aquatile]